MKHRRPTLIVSAHADTGFRRHSVGLRGGEYYGHLDNLVGVHSLLMALFSGRMARSGLRVELTHGEEVDFAGARIVARTVAPEDLVVVLDVTATPTSKSFVIEKCRSRRVAAFLRGALGGFSYDLYRGCPDPVSQSDEVDVYSRVTPHVFFLGVPCRGGDYNAGKVWARAEDVEAVSGALVAISRCFSKLWSPRRARGQS